MTGRLDGKVAIVTGASKGIGRAIAEMFAAEGAMVACAARTLRNGAGSEGSLEEVVGAIRAKGGEAMPVQCDVGVYEDCRRLVAAAGERYGPVDVLVNNAAVFEFKLVVDYSQEHWRREAAVNMDGPVWLSQLVLPGMIAKRSGSIINLSSPGVTGPGRGPYKEPGRGFTMYQAGKAFIERFTQGLAQEVYHHGVSVTCYSPSQGVLTPGMIKLGGMRGRNATDGEPAETTARAAVLLAWLPCEKIAGRVGYSQALLKEFGWAAEAKGAGADRPGSGFSQA